MKGNVTQTEHTQPYTPDVYQEINLDDLTLDELKALGTDEFGIDWSQTRHQTREAKARETARKHAPKQPPKFAGAIQSLIVWVGSITLLAAMYIVANVVMPLSMLALPYAEQARVQAGIRMFDPDNAVILSWIVVVFMLGLLFVQAHRGGKSSHTKPSLRTLARDLKYFIGVGKWRKRTITDTEKLNSAIVWNNRLIVFLGTVGALQDDIALYAEGKPWRAGLMAVWTQADLNTMFALIGGAVVTAALLFGMRFVVAYNYGRFMAMVSSADFLSDGRSDTSAAEDNAARQYVNAQIARRRAKLRQNKR